MTTNREELNALLAAGRIRIRDGAILNSVPPSLPADLDFSRVRGMMLGLAEGDALGNTSEGMTPHERKACFGEIRDYLPHPHFHDLRGYPSDDSQLAFWTLEQLIEGGGFVPGRVLDTFAHREIFGIGKTVKAALANRRNGIAWQGCGMQAAGNGALMRVAPILIPHLRAPSPCLWADTALFAMTTHNDTAAIASCVAFVSVLWRLLAMSPPEPQWWLDAFLDPLRQLETGDGYEGRSVLAGSFHGTLSQFLETELPGALREGLALVEAAERWHSGPYLLQTVPCVLYTLMRHAHDPEEAMVRAVNDTWDNDTVGAIVGAAAGALHGEAALPGRWRKGLSGRTSHDDDGRIFALLDEAERLFRPNIG